MATNNIRFGSQGYANPAQSGFAVTPNDAADLAYLARTLYVGTAGNLVVTMYDGNTVTLNNAQVGYHPLMVTRVWATGTTAANIVALY